MDPSASRTPAPGLAEPPVSDALDPGVGRRMLAMMVVRGVVNGAVLPFATVLLLRAGLPAAMLGPVAAGAALATLLGAPWWGRLGDRHGRRRVLALSFLVAIPAALAHASPELPLLVGAFLAWAAISAAFIPLTDSVALARLGGSRSRFARVRVGASGAYMVVVVLIGAAISFTALGWSAPGLVGAIACLVGFGIVAARLRGELRSGTGVAIHDTTGLLAGLRGGVGRYGTFLAGLSLAWAGINAPAIFTGPRVAEVGGSGFDIGLAVAAGTLVELPAFLLLPWLLRAAGGRRVFLVGGILLGVAGVLAALAPTPALLVLARLLFGAGFAWVVIPSLGAITASAGPSEHAAAAALHFASSAVGSLLVAAAGLPLVALTGSVASVLAVAAVAAPLGAIVALRGWPVPRPQRSAPVPT